MIPRPITDETNDQKAAATAAFQQWILSLSWQELIDAARIPLTATDESLLRDMVASHVPPPTPIYPGACPSRSFVFDGRSPAQRKHYRQRHAPRLLTLVDQAAYLHSSLAGSRRRTSTTRQQQSTSPPPVYDVSAKNFVCRDGHRWSIPPTEALRHADQEVVEGFVLEMPANSNHNTAIDGDDPPQSLLRWRGARVTTATDDQHKTNLFRLWRTASRGHFGTSNGRSTKLGTADWLDPTERWFSLAMFLVSRLEVVLYRRFRDDTTSTPTVPVGVASALSFDEATWQKTMASVLKKDVDDVFVKEQNARKCTLWELLDETMAWSSRNAWYSNSCDPFSENTCPPSVLPLLLMDSSFGRLWNELRRIHREVEARRIEQELLGDLEDEDTVKMATPKHPKPQKASKSSKKKKKKGSQKAQSTVPAQAVQDENSNEEGLDLAMKESSENSGMDDQLFFYPGSMPKEEDKAISREQNRNLVLALSILDDVLDQVYVEVGLGKGNNGKEDGLVPVGTKVGPVVKQTRFMKTKSIIPVPSRQSMELERIEESRQLDRLGPKPTKDSPSGRGHKLPASSGNLNGIPSNAKEQNSTWPFSQNGFIPYPTNQLDNGVIGSVPRPGNQALEGYGSSSAYDAFGSPTPWSKQGTPEVSLWEPHNYVTLEQWRTLQGLGGRDRSIMEEFFRTQRERELAKDESQMASSTIASIASSAEDVDVTVEDVMEVLDEESPLLSDDAEQEVEETEMPMTTEDDRSSPKILVIATNPQKVDHVDIDIVRESRSSDTITSASCGSRSASPQGPKAPSPTPSPILVSLEDLRGLRKEVVVVEKDRDSSSNNPSIKSFSSVPVATSGSLPNSPNEKKPRFTTALSQENLRTALSDDREPMTRPPKRSPSTVSEAEAARRQVLQTRTIKMKSRDDTEIRPRALARKPTDALDSYRNAAARSLMSRDDHDLHQGPTTPSPNPSFRDIAAVTPSRHHETPRVFGPLPFDATEGAQVDRCSRSEQGQDDFAHLQESRRSSAVDDGDNITVTRDGSTTITSALSQRETEESLREERDTYRDLCLTLGAEVASLKNLLAAYRGATSYASIGNNFGSPHGTGTYHFFDPDSVSHIAQRYSRQRTVAAMSDAGYRGEHESMASEDEFTRDKGSLAHRAQVSATATVGGSDISVEQSVRHETVPVAVPTLRNSYFQAPLGGFQSRLGRDIQQFVDSINEQLRKQDTRRAKAVERMSRLVTAVWPRAQVKTYGSHVTGLCLPSSDVDFVICLPAVHKNAPAVAPGALEGRNAINETSQKLLARKLKSESWIDPRSMQLIDRTVVPVIKVSTKDTRARSVHLDITFDSPNHHGVDAVDMVLDIMQELPMIRPLVLVLKSFLDDKNLLSAYKGGLSSYCLFLMTARYLQEQASSWGDCGSLLMGFLDFYGNHFNARTTGISVRNRLYFARPNYAPSMPTQPIWPPQVVPQHHMHSLPNSNDKAFARRNSFNDKGGIDGLRGATTNIDKHERYPAAGFQPVTTNIDPNQFNHGMPFTFEFDPLFVEDPLSPGNNVGRNAFRFPQIQRSFSDAHRALLAALEWDLESTEELQDATEYPLLKSLLRSEDIVCDL